MNLIRYGRILPILSILAFAFAFAFVGCTVDAVDSDADADYGITLNRTGTYTFPATTQGYGEQTPCSVTVTNTGNRATGNLITGISGANADSFTLSTTSLSSIVVGGNTAFTVVPGTGLATGTYFATVTVSGGNSISAQFDISFTVIPVGDPIPIASLNINITAPVKGGTPSATASGSEGFTVGTVTWSPDHNPFMGETEYTVTVTLTVENGYIFTGLNDAKINGQAAEISNNEGETVTISYTFPPLTKEVTAIVIKTQPNKLIYTDGETLDLTGLVITLTYDDTTIEDVEIDDFYVKGITTIPSHGDTLSRSEYNDQPVVISSGSKQVNTDKLIVNSAPTSVTITGFNITKVYDGTNTVIDFGSPTFSGLQNYETATVDMTDVIATYAQETAGTGISVTYTGTFTMTGGTAIASNYEIIQPANLAGTITLASPEAPGALTENSKTNNSITLNKPADADPLFALEYGRDTSNNAAFATWQDDLIFTDLSAGTTYYFFARYKADLNKNYVSAASPSLSVATLQTVTQGRIEYYWVNQHGSLVTTSGGATSVGAGESLTITAQSAGYTVKQWYLNSVYTGQSGSTYNFVSQTAGQHTVGLFVEKDGKLYNTNIIITVDRVTVTYDINGGSGATPVSQTVSAGSSVTFPGGNGFSKTGYTFSGWNTEPSGTGTNYNAGSSYVPKGNITLYAVWTFMITYNINNGTGTTPSAQTVFVGSGVTLDSGSGFSRAGYTFSGWNTNSSGTGTNYSAGSSYTPTGNITLYAQWTSTVTYDINNGTGTTPSAQTVPAGSGITLPNGDEFSRIDYTFIGWSTEPSGTGTNYGAGSSYIPTGSITLYAKWGIPLTENIWTTGEITSSNSDQWFSFTATASTQYIWINNQFDVNFRIYDSVYNTDGLRWYTSGDDYWYWTMNLSIGQVYYIRVWPQDSSDAGTFRITFNTSTTISE